MNGLLLIDKPTGLTSHDVVYKVRRSLGIKGVGHAGTLDPLASGLLVLLIGEATKVSDYLLNGDKGYEFHVKLGVRTDSMDITGAVLEERPVLVDEAKIREISQSMAGTLELDVPVHSAVKVDGKRLYKFAHAGERPDEIPKRAMHFYDVEVAEMEGSSVLIRLKCSKGSFVRAWANEFGLRLGCGGTVETLRRNFSAPFTVDQALNLDDFVDQPEELGDSWVPLAESLPHFSRLDVEGRDVAMLRNGQISKPMEIELLRFVQVGVKPPPVKVISRETNQLLALLLAEAGEHYRIKRVFKYA